jgi:Txe/YoeB family toxin of Txe-Axe toxin-antitoxin module
MNNKKIFVAFADEKIKKAFEDLKEKDPKLYKFINRAINNLKENPFCGIPISKKLIPKDYIKKYKINNLWKYNLPGAWRLFYFVVGDEIKIISIILEWLPHKKYERKFGY